MENCNSEIPDVLHHKGNAEINLLSLVHASWIQFCAEKTFSFFAAIQLDQRWSPTANTKCCKFILLGITLINDYIVFNHNWKRKVLQAVRRDISAESSEGFSFQSMISQKFCFFQSGFLRKDRVTVCQQYRWSRSLSKPKGSAAFPERLFWFLSDWTLGKSLTNAFEPWLAIFTWHTPCFLVMNLFNSYCITYVVLFYSQQLSDGTELMKNGTI